MIDHLKAANDNFNWISYVEDLFAGDNEDSDFDASNVMIKFDEASAARLGLPNRVVSLDFLEYLLSGRVAPADQEAAELIEALIAKYS